MKSLPKPFLGSVKRVHKREKQRFLKKFHGPYRGVKNFQNPKMKNFEMVDETQNFQKSKNMKSGVVLLMLSSRNPVLERSKIRGWEENGSCAAPSGVQHLI